MNHLKHILVPCNFLDSFLIFHSVFFFWKWNSHNIIAYEKQKHGKQNHLFCIANAVTVLVFFLAKQIGVLIGYSIVYIIIITQSEKLLEKQWSSKQHSMKFKLKWLFRFTASSPQLFQTVQTLGHI